MLAMLSQSTFQGWNKGSGCFGYLLWFHIESTVLGYACDFLTLLSLLPRNWTDTSELESLYILFLLKAYLWAPQSGEEKSEGEVSTRYWNPALRHNKLAPLLLPAGRPLTKYDSDVPPWQECRHAWLPPDAASPLVVGSAFQVLFWKPSLDQALWWSLHTLHSSFDCDINCLCS